MAEENQESPRVESLRHKLAADPDSRVFYQLGEELRKAGNLEEAEKVLRDGLEKHGSYLSAWVSLGRALLEGRKFDDAVGVLEQGLALDPQNIVTARLLADCHYERRDAVESIKKYKLVRALLPTDEVVAERIDQLERILDGTEGFEEGSADEPSAADPSATETGTSEPDPASEPEDTVIPPPPPAAVDELDAGETAAMPESGEDPLESDGVFETRADGDETPTVTMGDLYAEQGHTDQAREIYERVLENDPDSSEAADRLRALDRDEVERAPETGETSQMPARSKVVVLEDWLSKVSRR